MQWLFFVVPVLETNQLFSKQQNASILSEITTAGNRYLTIFSALGQAIAKSGLGFVYGGGSKGVMGVVSGAALEGGGDVIGMTFISFIFSPIER